MFTFNIYFFDISPESISYLHHGGVTYKLPEMTEFIFQCGSGFSRDDGFVGRAVFHLSENMSQEIGESVL